jgi:thymidylate kinase
MRKSKGHLICLTGIDGAGKTTLAHYLATSLSEHGKNYRYVYARFLPILVRPIWAVARLLFLHNQNIDRDYTGYTATKRSLLHSKMLAKCHETAIILDYWIQIILKVSVPLHLGINLVCDRYVYDTVISDLAPDISYSLEQTRRIIDQCFRIMPRPDIVFLLDVPETVTMERKSDVVAKEYLTERRHVYRLLATDGYVVTLKGTDPLAQLQDEAIAAIREQFD